MASRDDVDAVGRPAQGGTWRARAVDRSLAEAEALALSRTDRFIRAAMELLAEGGHTDFTVQDVVDRAGLSLRSFYKHFSGKDELLSAILEESLIGFVEVLRADVDAHDDVVERLRAYVTGFVSRTLVAPAGWKRALGLFHLHMMEGRQELFVQALVPQMDLLRGLVQAGVDAGRFRSDLDVEVLTVLLVQTMMAAAQMNVLDVSLGDVAIEPDDLWAWCAAAVVVR